MDRSSLQECKQRKSSVGGYFFVPFERVNKRTLKQKKIVFDPQRTEHQSKRSRSFWKNEGEKQIIREFRKTDEIRD